MSQTTSHRGTGEAAVIGPDWSKVSKDEMALYIGRLEDSLRMASETQAELRAEVDEYDKLRERMADILTHTVNALRGNPDTDYVWSWHDMPEIAAALTNERDQLRAENLALIEQCAQACEAESVDADETGSAEDRAYNMAITHAAAAIRALNVKGPF